MKTLSIQLILLLLKNGSSISTSYQLHQLFTRLGIFLAVEDLIMEMEQEQLVTTDGYFEGTSKLIKNIQITQKGMEFITASDITTLLSDMESTFENFDLIKKILVG
jgi:hypothetical protein